MTNHLTKILMKDKCKSCNYEAEYKEQSPAPHICQNSQDQAGENPVLSKEALKAVTIVHRPDKDSCDGCFAEILLNGVKVHYVPYNVPFTIKKKPYKRCQKLQDLNETKTHYVPSELIEDKECKQAHFEDIKSLCEKIKTEERKRCANIVKQHELDCEMAHISLCIAEILGHINLSND